MSDDLTFEEALVIARSHAEAGLAQYPYDAIYRTTLLKLDQIAAVRAAGCQLSDVPHDPDIGLMAAKELGNDEAAFAHALHVIQYELDHAGRRR